MKNKPFSDIKPKRKTTKKTDFIESAKVDGNNTDSSTTFDMNERRGPSYFDKETGKRVKLSGKSLQIPVNGYELHLLEEISKKMGLPLASYLRNLGIEAAKKDK